MSVTSSRATTLSLTLVLCLQGFCIAQAPAEQARMPGNFFANADFGLGRQFWDLGKGGKTAATFDVNSDDAPPGGQAALIGIEAVDSWGVQFGQPVEGGKRGKTYTFAVLARSAGEPVKVRLEIERRANPYDRAARSDEATLTRDRWTELHTTFTVDKDFREGWFAYVSCSQVNAKFRLAMFRLYEGAYTAYTAQQRQMTAVAGVSLFDTIKPSAGPLAGEALAKREGWTTVPEDTTAHAFKGDTVLMNNRLALVLRPKGPGAEIYSIDPAAVEKRVVLRPAIAEAVKLSAVKILENNPASASIEATFKSSTGQSLTMGYELRMGQVFVAVNPGSGNKAIRVDAPCRFAVMPDFFADDIVVDATALKVQRAELPGDNFLLNMLDGGSAIMMAVWNNREDDIAVALSGDGSQRRIDSADIPCGNKGKVWVAILSAPNIWHVHDVARADAGKIVPVDWKSPLPAMWRVDWRRDDGLADSWEMIMERPGGDFVKHGLVGSSQTIPADRHRWTTVLGSFPYPCWIDKAGQAFLQPLKSNARFIGPAIVYPLGRSPSTPLDAFTVVDMVRATLGVGPCEYILDIEGQQSQYKGRATCANRDTLDPIYEKGQQVARKAEIEKSLAEVIVFIRHIRSRIQGYVDFGHEVLAYLGQQKQAHPELAKAIGELEELTKAIDQRLERRRKGIKTPDEAAVMIEAFRKDGLDDTGPNAFGKCKKFTASIVEIGSNQDELVGECRLAVRLLRQRAALIVAEEPKMADVAREIRTRSQKVLRNPAGHEGARH